MRQRAQFESDALLLAEKLLKSHGYVVLYVHDAGKMRKLVAYIRKLKIKAARFTSEKEMP